MEIYIRSLLTGAPDPGPAEKQSWGADRTVRERSEGRKGGKDLREPPEHSNERLNLCKYKCLS